MKLILTDVDGVLLDWEHMFIRWMNSKGICNGVTEFTSHDLGTVFNYPDHEMLNHIEVFNESAYMGYLPPLRDSIKYVKKLHEEHGFMFRCITSLGTNPYSMKLRIRNLETLFGASLFDGFEFFDVTESKISALSRFKDTGYPWIEDKPSNALLGADLGLTSYLINHRYNTHDMNLGDVQRVNSWKQIYDMIS